MDVLLFQRSYHCILCLQNTHINKKKSNYDYLIPMTSPVLIWKYANVNCKTAAMLEDKRRRW